MVFQHFYGAVIIMASHYAVLHSKDSLFTCLHLNNKHLLVICQEEE